LYVKGKISYVLVYVKGKISYVLGYQVGEHDLVISYALGNDAVPSYHGTCENWSVNRCHHPLLDRKVYCCSENRRGGGVT